MCDDLSRRNKKSLGDPLRHKLLAYAARQVMDSGILPEVPFSLPAEA
jgi:hypothetical protein